jgi:hypothetical protein
MCSTVSVWRPGCGDTPTTAPSVDARLRRRESQGGRGREEGGKDGGEGIEQEGILQRLEAVLRRGGSWLLGREGEKSRGGREGGILSLEEGSCGCCKRPCPSSRRPP